MLRRCWALVACSARPPPAPPSAPGGLFVTTCLAPTPPLLQISDNGTLVKGAFVRVRRRRRLAGGAAAAAGAPAHSTPARLARMQDRFIGWECAGAGGVIHFWTDSTDYDDGEIETTPLLLCIGMRSLLRLAWRRRAAAAIRRSLHSRRPPPDAPAARWPAARLQRAGLFASGSSAWQAY